MNIVRIFHILGYWKFIIIFQRFGGENIRKIQFFFCNENFNLLIWWTLEMKLNVNLFLGYFSMETWNSMFNWITRKGNSSIKEIPRKMSLEVQQFLNWFWIIWRIVEMRIYRQSLRYYYYYYWTILREIVKKRFIT